MNKIKLMGALCAASLLSTTIAAEPALAQSRYHQDDHGRYDEGRHDNGRHNGNYRNNGNYGSYDAARHYRKGNYRERQLGANDRVYRGRDNRYYCRRSDGTTGLLVGALGGGVLGNVIAPGGSKTLGTLLGGGAGALVGRSVDRNNVRCR